MVCGLGAYGRHKSHSSPESRLTVLLPTLELRILFWLFVCPAAAVRVPHRRAFSVRVAPLRSARFSWLCVSDAGASSRLRRVPSSLYLSRKTEVVEHPVQRIASGDLTHERHDIPVDYLPAKGPDILDTLRYTPHWTL